MPDPINHYTSASVNASDVSTSSNSTTHWYEPLTITSSDTTARIDDLVVELRHLSYQLGSAFGVPAEQAADAVRSLGAALSNDDAPDQASDVAARDENPEESCRPGLTDVRGRCDTEGMTTNTNPTDRTAFQLRSEGQTYRQIAETLGLNNPQAAYHAVTREGRRQNVDVRTRTANDVQAVAEGITVASSDRQFGIEFECCVPSVDDAIAAIRAEGIEIRDERSRAYTDRITNEGYAGWMVKYDCTVSPTRAQRSRGITTGCEIISPPLRGTDGVEQVRKVSRALLSIGTAVNKTCGTHVHHDFNGETGETIARFVEAYAANQDNLNKLVAPSRRGRRSYCGPLSSSEVSSIGRQARTRSTDEMRRGYGLSGDRYRNVNVQAFAKYGTIEVRQHHGTVDADKILAWVAVGQSMVEAVKAEPMGRSRGITGLIADLRSHGLCDEAASYLRNRVSQLG